MMTTAGTRLPTRPPRPLAAPIPPPSTWQVRGGPRRWLGQGSGYLCPPPTSPSAPTDGSLHPSAELWSPSGQAGFGPMLGGGSSPLPLPPAGGSSVGSGSSGGFGSLHQHERMVGPCEGAGVGVWAAPCRAPVTPSPPAGLPATRSRGERRAPGSVHLLLGPRSRLRQCLQPHAPRQRGRRPHGYWPP